MGLKYSGRGEWRQTHGRCLLMNTKPPFLRRPEQGHVLRMDFQAIGWDENEKLVNSKCDVINIDRGSALELEISGLAPPSWARSSQNQVK